MIRRGDGSPVFLIANAVDDHDMGITHVIREDLLNTAPKVMLLWDALGYGEKPVYAHLPLLVNEQRKKLSKRRIRWRWPPPRRGVSARCHGECPRSAGLGSARRGRDSSDG